MLKGVVRNDCRKGAVPEGQAMCIAHNVGMPKDRPLQFDAIGKLALRTAGPKIERHAVLALQPLDNVGVDGVADMAGWKDVDFALVWEQNCNPVLDGIALTTGLTD
jgi:hypothetical protein